ncbi:hypothetical protein [Leucobacter sp. M11]|uniref:hypothetical protein n=1 Tax=Leucobacter sp. M11 TaxID=2993565 RepID=UPI002D7E7D77|nr:hypothetical protein [Leucobacter sp. M11]MEB4615842.1 hypothetical protein [Leucobacter sp. M11]
MSTASVISIVVAVALLLGGAVLQLWGMRIVTRRAGTDRVPLLRHDPDTPMSVRSWLIGGITVMGLGTSLLAGTRVWPWWAVIALFLGLIALTAVLPVLRHNRAAEGPA